MLLAYECHLGLLFFCQSKGSDVQTFLPFPDFRTSAAILDRQRLGKQRVENLQIMSALMTGRGWVSHPATLMWRRYEWALKLYHEAIISEWVDERGYSDTTAEKLDDVYYHNLRWTEERVMPYWLGDERFHRSHQSNLVRKDPWYYLRYFPKVSTSLEYVWPVPEDMHNRLLITHSR